MLDIAAPPNSRSEFRVAVSPTTRRGSGRTALLQMPEPVSSSAKRSPEHVTARLGRAVPLERVFRSPAKLHRPWSLALANGGKRCLKEVTH